MLVTAWRPSSLILLLAILAAVLLGAPRAASAHEGEAFHAHDETDVWAVARGGQLYDNWMAILEAVAPQDTNEGLNRIRSPNALPFSTCWRHYSENLD